MPVALKDSTFWGLVLLAIGLLLAALVFYRMDAGFLERAALTDAVVIDKTERSAGASSGDRRSVRFEWTDPDRPDRSHQGAGAYSGGEEAFDALVIGESTVRIAWAYSDDGRSLENRLVEDGFVGVPWPMLIIGLGLLIAAPIRWIVLQRKQPRDDP